MTTIHRCASPRCPGYAYPATALVSHPSATCGDASTPDVVIDVESSHDGATLRAVLRMPIAGNVPSTREHRRMMALAHTLAAGIFASSPAETWSVHVDGVNRRTIRTEQRMTYALLDVVIEGDRGDEVERDAIERALGAAAYLAHLEIRSVS